MSSHCPNCTRPMPPDSPSGLCPRCLLGAAMPEADRPADQTLSLDGHFNAPPVDELAPLFPQLELIDLLGHGGMGAVYRARQKNLDRPVALKILSPRLGKDPSFAERFMREARTMARLSHANIVTVFDFGEAGGFYYLIMELIEGVNLREAILARTILPEQAITIIPKICEALQFAHDQGIVHRDIKPENILIGNNGVVKIADFGLAKMVGSSDYSFALTGTHQVLGTRNYMAPEQIEKPMTVDHRADIYSLGVVFYELLTGELPLGRFSLPSEKATIRRELDDIVLRTLEKEPGRRYQQASAIKTDVESLESPLPHGRGDAQAEHAPVENADRHEPPPNTGSDTGRNRTSLPVFHDKVHGGFSQLHGILAIDGDTLELSYRVKRLGLVDSVTRKVRIPIAAISRAGFHRGLTKHTLELQAATLETFEDIPCSTQGRCLLHVDRKLFELLETFANQLNAKRSTVDRTATPRPAALAQLAFKVPSDTVDITGLARLCEDRLQVEVQQFDWLGSPQSPPFRIDIPLNQIIALKYKVGLLGHRIEVQTDSMELVAPIPNSTQGKFVMRARRSDGAHAREFAQLLARRSGLPVPQSLLDAKPAASRDEARQKFRQRTSLVRWFLPTSAAINLVFLALVAVANIHALHEAVQDVSRWHPLTEEAFVEVTQHDFVEWSHIDGIVFTAGAIIMIPIAAVAWFLLSRTRHLALLAILVVAMLFPVHPGVILAIPGGIWLGIELIRNRSWRLFGNN